MEYWTLLSNPRKEVYREMIDVLCKNSDSFYFITREEMDYDEEYINQYKPFLIKTYKSNEWAQTKTMGPYATVYVIQMNRLTHKLLRYSSESLYGWKPPKLPEDLTFFSQGAIWFTCTTHENMGSFHFHSIVQKQLIERIDGLKIQKGY